MQEPGYVDPESVPVAVLDIPLPRYKESEPAFFSGPKLKSEPPCQITWRRNALPLLEPSNNSGSGSPAPVYGPRQKFLLTIHKIWPRS